MTDIPVFADAACAGLTRHEADVVFFNETNDWTNNAARKLCGSCPVQQECLDYALKVNVVGFWGGMSHRQRSAERARLGIQAESIGFPYHFFIDSDWCQSADMKCSKWTAQKHYDRGEDPCDPCRATLAKKQAKMRERAA